MRVRGSFRRAREMCGFGYEDRGEDALKESLMIFLRRSRGA